MTKGTIAGVEIRTIEARRFTKPFEAAPGGQVRVDHNSTVTHLAARTPQEAVVEFSYTTSFGAFGVIKLDGSLLWREEHAGEVAAQWEKTRKMPNEVASMIHSTVLQVCLPEAVGFAKLLRLPPPIPLPQVQFQEGKPGSGAAIGPEIA